MEISGSIAQFFYLILTFMGFNFLLHQEGSDASMWKVTSADGVEIYFLEDEAQTKHAEFKNLNTVLVEADIELLQNHNFDLYVQQALYEEGNNLKKEITNQTYKKLEQKTGTLGLPLNAVENLKPWFVAGILQAHELKDIEDDFFQRMNSLQQDLKKQGKKVQPLESPDFQKQLFSELSPKDQIQFLNYALETDPVYLKPLLQIFSSETKRDPVKLKQMKAKTIPLPENLYRSLISKRHRHWVDEIEKVAQQEKSFLVILNPGHLQDAGSLMQQLKDRGFKVEKINAAVRAAGKTSK